MLRPSAHQSLTWSKCSFFSIYQLPIYSLFSKALTFRQCACPLWSSRSLAKCRHSYACLMGLVQCIEIALNSEPTTQTSNPASLSCVAQPGKGSCFHFPVPCHDGNSPRCSGPLDKKTFKVLFCSSVSYLGCPALPPSRNDKECCTNVELSLPQPGPASSATLHSQRSSQEGPGQGLCCLCHLLYQARQTTVFIYPRWQL